MPIPLILGAGVRVAAGRLVGAAVRSAVGSAAKTALRTSATRLNSSLRSIFNGARNKPLIKPIIKVDTSRFDRAMRAYLRDTKKDFAEVINTKAYYIARNAVQLTSATSKEKIESELNAPSQVNPDLTLANVIAIKGGLKGKKLQTVSNKIKRARVSFRNFLRSGWIWSVKEMERFVKKKSGPKYPKLKTKGQAKGGAKGARANSWKPIASIFNTVTGGTDKHGLDKKSNPAEVNRILTEGLQAAIDKEADNTEQYLLKKRLEQRAREFNRK